MGYRIDSTGPYSTAQVLKAMLQAVRDRSGMLQSGVSVTWTIRGNNYDFGYVVRTGTGGLHAMMKRRIERDLEAL